MSLSFFAETVAGIEQLWVSDGTAAGTHMVRAFAANPITQLTMIGARVFFTVDDGVHGNELWVSDGTAAGTVLVSDINPGATGSSPFDLTIVNGTLFFSANDGTHGTELWKTDGTAAGTVLVKDTDPGATGGVNTSPFIDVNGTLFFTATDMTHGVELWKSDGTGGGTTMVADINPGAGSSFPLDFTNVNGTLFFAAFDATHGTELWKSDGTAAGTVMVMDINPGAGSSMIAIPGSTVLANINGTLFFDANDGSHGFELWRSDGTAAGTFLVKDIDPGGGSSVPFNLTNVNGTLFFGAFDGTHGNELWKSDGTAAGTVMIKDINPGPGDSISLIPAAFAAVGGTYFFAATDGSAGTELWKSDGTAAGTVMVKDINPGAGSSAPRMFANVNGLLEFYAFDGTSFGLWQSDGTTAGTIELATHVDIGSFNSPIGFTPQPAANDFNGDRMSDILWRNSSGGLADWTMNGGAITSGSFVTSGGTFVTPDATWSVAGISDFNGDGNADVLWRNTDGTLATWLMNGSTLTSGAFVNLGGAVIKPDATWSVAGTGDFDGDTRSDILWRNSGGALSLWTMNGSSIVSAGALTSGGTAVTPDATWSVAGIGDFNGDNRKDILWRNTSGAMSVWTMNGTSITSGGAITSGGSAITPDASWSVAGVGDFNRDGASDILWRNSNGSLAVWLMNGSAITGSGAITFGGSPIAPDATWHIVEVGDFNGDSNTDILWRNDNGSMSEWLMNGTTIMQAVTPNAGGTSVSPDATWSTQTKPTIS